MSTDTNETRPEYGAHGAILRSAKAERLAPYDHVYNTWAYTASAGDEPADLLQPSYWLALAEQLRAGDTIKAFPSDQRWFAELLVRHVGPDGVAVQQLRGGMLDESFPAPGSMASSAPAAEAETAEYRFDGPVGRWQVWQGEKLLKQNLASEADARRWFTDHVAGIRRDQVRQRRAKM